MITITHLYTREYSTLYICWMYHKLYHCHPQWFYFRW